MRGIEPGSVDIRDISPNLFEPSPSGVSEGYMATSSMIAN